MKEIKAVIKPTRLPRLREAFRKIPDFPGMTVLHAEGSGYHPNKPMPHGIKSELTEYTDKMRIEVLCPDEQVAMLLQVIHDICHSGQIGDGVVWVTPVEFFHRLREPLGPGASGEPEPTAI
jgi:nitrogen regulatory protein P-II 1